MRVHESYPRISETGFGRAATCDVPDSRSRQVPPSQPRPAANSGPAGRNSLCHFGVFAFFLATVVPSWSDSPATHDRIGQVFSFLPAGAVARAAEPLHPQVYSEASGWGFEPDFPVRPTTNGVTADGTYFFSAQVPTGNWRVTVRLVGAAEGSRVTIKAELRRLMVETLPLAAGATVDRSFIVNVRTPEIPAQGAIAAGRVRLKSPRETTQEAWAWDDRLTLEFSGEHVVVQRIELVPVEVPTVYLLGDSTVCDQSREPFTSWGQMFTRFFDDRLAIASHAESGESYRDSIRERRLDKVLTLLRPGDWVLLQFGHNDQKQIAAGTGGPFTTYRDEIKHYVTTIRQAGGIPVVIAPMERRAFDEVGKIKPSLTDYATAAQQAARENGADFIDLHALSIPFYEALGPERSGRAFAVAAGKPDETHHSGYGAYELARCVATASKAQGLSFAKYLRADFQPFDPAHPDDPDAFAVPASPLVTTVRPLGN